MGTNKHEFTVRLVASPVYSECFRSRSLISQTVVWWIACGALFSANGCVSSTVTLPFEKRYAEPFYTPNAEIVWAATNRLPATVAVYKVAPANFSTTAVSNLTAMGGRVDPKRGWMALDHEFQEPLVLENVPDQAMAVELGTNLLARLGIPFDELQLQDGAPKAWFYPCWRVRFDKIAGRHVEELCWMGIEFRRVVDGLPCYGQRAYFQFESHQTLTRIEVKWHGLVESGRFSLASPEQIVSWIREGRARAHPQETTGSRWIRVADIRRVVIRDAEVVYDAGPDFGLFEPTPKNLYPYVALEAEIEFAPGDCETILLFCPVIKEAMCRPVRKTAEFNILPKDFEERQRPPQNSW